MCKLVTASVLQLVPELASKLVLHMVSSLAIALYMHCTCTTQVLLDSMRNGWHPGPLWSKLWVLWYALWRAQP